MPSTRTPAPYDSCHPCKWFAHNLWKSGRNPIYHSYCEHPSHTQKDGPYISNFDGGHGKYIGDNTDHRPQWCPIRGDAKAEKEAMADE